MVGEPSRTEGKPLEFLLKVAVSVFGAYAHGSGKDVELVAALEESFPNFPDLGIANSSQVG